MSSRLVRRHVAERTAAAALGADDESEDDEVVVTRPNAPNFLLLDEDEEHTDTDSDAGEPKQEEPEEQEDDGHEADAPQVKGFDRKDGGGYRRIGRRGGARRELPRRLPHARRGEGRGGEGDYV